MSSLARQTASGWRLAAVDAAEKADRAGVLPELIEIFTKLKIQRKLVYKNEESFEEHDLRNLIM